MAAACEGNGALSDAKGRPAIGTQYSYALMLNTRSELPKGDLGARTNFDYTLRARLVLSPVSDSQDERQFLLTLDSPEISSKIEGSGEQFATLASELRHAPFLFSLRDGRLVESRMPRTISAFAGAILLTIASQFQLPAERPSVPVERSEHDGTGDYTVRYEPGVTSTELKKSKLRYGKLMAVSQASKAFSQDALTPKIEKSIGALEVDGALLRAANVEETLTSMMFGTGELKTHTSLTLKLVETEDAPERDLSALRAQTSRYEAGRPFFKQPTRKLFDEVRLDGRSFDEVTAALVKGEQDPRAMEFRKGDERKLSQAEREGREGWLKSQTEAFGGLVALYREQPETIMRAHALIRENAPSSRALIDGLATAGNVESQRSLIQLMQDSELDSDVRTRAASALFRTKTPNAELARVAEAALEDPMLRMQAIYGAGTFARLLRESGDVARSDRLSELLIARLHASTTPETTMHLLRGISNSAYTGAIPAIVVRMSDPDDDVRAAAVDALRLMDDPRVDVLIATEIQRPQASTDHRLSAVGACQGRRATRPLVDAIVDRALRDESKSVKFKAISLLEDWKNDFPEASATLKKVSETDAEADTREAARLAL